MLNRINRINYFMMKTFKQYLEAVQPDQLKQLLRQQREELDIVQKTGNVDQVMQTLKRHQSELVPFTQIQKSLPLNKGIVNQNPFLGF